MASVKVLANILEDIKYYLSALSVVIGIIFCFFGLRFIKVTAFLIGFLIFFIITVILLGFLKFKEGYDEGDVYFVLISSIIAGILGGVLISFLEKLVTFLAGFGIGMLLSATFEMFILGMLDSDNKYLFWSIAFIVGLIVGAVALAFHDWIIIIMTTLYGAELICTSALLIIYPAIIEDYNGEDTQ